MLKADQSVTSVGLVHSYEAAIFAGSSLSLGPTCCLFGRLLFFAFFCYAPITVANLSIFGAKVQGLREEHQPS